MNNSAKKAKVESSAAGDAARFEEVFHQLVNEVISEDETNPEIADAAKRFRKVSVTGHIANKKSPLKRQGIDESDLKKSL